MDLDKIMDLEEILASLDPHKNLDIFATGAAKKVKEPEEALKMIEAAKLLKEKEKQEAEGKVKTASPKPQVDQLAFAMQLSIGHLHEDSSFGDEVSHGVQEGTSVGDDLIHKNYKSLIGPPKAVQSAWSVQNNNEVNFYEEDEYDGPTKQDLQTYQEDENYQLLVRRPSVQLPSWSPGQMNPMQSDEGDSENDDDWEITPAKGRGRASVRGGRGAAARRGRGQGRRDNIPAGERERGGKRRGKGRGIEAFSEEAGENIWPVGPVRGRGIGMGLGVGGPNVDTDRVRGKRRGRPMMTKEDHDNRDRINIEYHRRVS